MPIRYERVREFLRLDEGDPPPVFVGRGAILGDILDIAIRKAGRPKVTRIVQGAPGAGKTSLLHEMQRLWTGENGTPRVVTLSSTDITDDTAVGVGAVLDAWTMDKVSWRKALMDRLKGINAIGAGPGGFSVGFSDAEIPKTLRMLARKHPAREGSVPIIVAVDEAQRLAGDRTTPEARFLQAIHDGTTGLPLSLVLAGLSDTQNRAREMDLTRSVVVHEVGRLEAWEARTFMEKACRHFGLDISRHIPQLHDLVHLCDGWPRHLHHAGVALAEEALRVNGDLERIVWTDVESETRRKRREYYESQYSLEMRESNALVAKVMETVPESRNGSETTTGTIARTTLLGTIVGHCRTGDSPQDIPWSLPDGMTPRRFLAHLIHRGALYDDGRDSVHSPIPSFRSYLIEAGTEPMPGSSLKEKDGDDSTARRTRQQPLRRR